MHEDSEAMNDSESGISEVILFPETSHSEELLLSDQGHINIEEANNYERKLDEKLRDLGLYEDDMTIHQKEELLAVVVVSCETAEQEESRRRLIRDYLDGSNASFSGENVEFSFTDEASLLCSSTQNTEDHSSNISNTSCTEYETSLDKQNYAQNFSSEFVIQQNGPVSSPDIFEDETVLMKNYFEPQPSTSREIKSKRRPVRRGRPRRGRGSSRFSSTSEVKVAVTHPFGYDQTSNPSEELLDKQIYMQRQKLLLEKSMSSWRPCLSPKDEPLSSRREEREEDLSPSNSEQDNQKYLKIFDDLSSLFLDVQKFSSKTAPLDKPYLIIQHGSKIKKLNKLDSFDTMIGVSDTNDFKDEICNYESASSLTQYNCPSRTKSAFQHVKPRSYNKLHSFVENVNENKLSHGDGSYKTTRSGATYGGQKILDKYSEVKQESSPEVTLDDTFNQFQDMFDEDHSVHSLQNMSLDFHTAELHNSSDEKLPEFSKLRPDIISENNIIVNNHIRNDGPQVDPVHYKSSLTVSSPSKSSHKMVHLVSLPEREGYSSDSSSSLIDVETIVDDEIEKFVLKRKMQPELNYSGRSKSSQPKRLKRKNL